MKCKTTFYINGSELPDYVLGNDFEGLYIETEYHHTDNKSVVKINKVSYRHPDNGLIYQFKHANVRKLIEILESLLMKNNYDALTLTKLSMDDNTVLKLTK